VAESVRTPRDAIAQRPEPEVLLRIAIRERDGVAAAILVQQWVHRRGLSDLEQFQQNLVMGEDPEAGFWLRRQWDDPLAEPPIVASPAPETPLPTPAVLATQEPVATEQPLAAAEPPAPAGATPDPGSLSVAADAEEQSRPRDPSPLLEETFTEPLSEELRILLATPLEDPFGEPAPRKPRAAIPAMPPLAEASLETLHPTPFAAPAEGDDEDGFAPAVADSPHLRRGRLSRMKARMRGYIDEAMEVLHRVTLPSSLEEQGAEQPSAASGPVDSSSGFFASPSPDPASQAALLPQELEENAAAAPTPTTLADLRSWLPDASGDLPRAS